MKKCQHEGSLKKTSYVEEMFYSKTVQSLIIDENDSFLANWCRRVDLVRFFATLYNCQLQAR